MPLVIGLGRQQLAFRAAQVVAACAELVLGAVRERVK